MLGPQFGWRLRPPPHNAAACSPTARRRGGGERGRGRAACEGDSGQRRPRGGGVGSGGAGRPHKPETGRRGDGPVKVLRGSDSSEDLSSNLYDATCARLPRASLLSTPPVRCPRPARRPSRFGDENEAPPPSVPSTPTAPTSRARGSTPRRSAWQPWSFGARTPASPPWCGRV